MFHVTHISTAKTWRGGEQQIYYLMNHLNGKINQSIFCPYNAVLLNKIEIPINKITFNKRGSINILVARKLKKYTVENKVDLVHIHDSHAHNIYFLACILFGLKIPAIITRRIEKPITNIVSKYKYNHQNIQKIICVSDAVKETISPFITDKEKLKTIHSGIDIDKYNKTAKDYILHKTFNIPTNSILIGTIGALTNQKDHFTFIDVAEKILLKKEAYFIIIGSGKLEKEIKETINNKKLQSRIFLAGFRNDIPTIIKDLDIFLFTSIFEGLGTVLLDAMASGIPIVSTDVSGIPEIIENDKNGLLSKPKDTTNLASQVSELIENDEKRNFFIKNGLLKINQFSAENMAQQNFETYLDIIQ